MTRPGRATGRPREFDETEVVRAARDLFWRRGYHATSVADLVDGLGVLRGSLYGAFGDKHGLFLRALASYAEEMHAVAAPLREDGPMLPRVRAVLMGVLDAGARRPGYGCMLGNTATELLPDDGEAAAIVAATFAALEGALTEAFARGQATGEVRAGVTPGALARLFVALSEGLHVLARSERDPARLRDAVDAAMASVAA